MLHMEQKDYKFEVVDELLKEEGYARNIARDLKTNHMIIVRKLKELSEENVVDFKVKGKNKVYFLKKTTESRTYVYNTENYKLKQILKKYPSLRKLIEEIQKNQKIKLAILFGSYAKRTAGKNSDIDIYIETQDREIKKQIESIDTKLSIKIGKYDKNSLLVKEIEKNHIMIKGVERYYEANKFLD